MFMASLGYIVRFCAPQSKNETKSKCPLFYSCDISVLRALLALIIGCMSLQEAWRGTLTDLLGRFPVGLISACRQAIVV